MQVKISQNRIQYIMDYAKRSYQDYYKRMYQNDKTRYEKVFIGKLGEEAVATFLDVAPSYEKGINKGFDLEKGGVKIAVKSKKVKEFPKNLEQWYAHIPIDQYEKIKENTDILVFCFVKVPIVNIIGYLPLSVVNKIKILHRAGNKITPYFSLPHPDSYAVPLTKFIPLSSSENHLAS